MKRALRDRSTSGIVMHCALCPHWNAFAFTPAEAEQAEIRHEQLVHPDDFTVRKRAANRAYDARRRAAVKESR